MTARIPHSKRSPVFDRGQRADTLRPKVSGRAGCRARDRAERRQIIASDSLLGGARMEVATDSIPTHRKRNKHFARSSTLSVKHPL